MSESHPTARRPLSSRALVTPERIIRILLGVAVLAVLGMLLWYFARLVIYLVVGMVIAYLLRPVTDRIQGFGLSRVPAILVTFILVIGGISIILTSFVPFTARQLTDLSRQVTNETVNSLATSLEAQVRQVLPFVEEGTLINGVTQISETLFQEQQLTQVVGSLVGVFTDIFYALLIIPFITFFFLKDGLKIRRKLLSLVPNRFFEVTLAIFEKIETNIGRYLRALLFQCTSVATLATILLYFAGLKYSLVLGLFTGLANTIPYFGPVMGFIAGTLVAIAQTGDFSLLPGLLIAMGLTQATDNVIFQPLFFSRAARTHPLVILFVVLIGAQLAGIVGMLIAIPVTTTVLVGVEQVLWSLRNYRILKVA